MPRENRKRGKKHKKNTEEASQSHSYDHPSAALAEPELEPIGEPSWMINSKDHEEFNPEAPFGYVDTDLKAYFRTVDVQLRDWQEGQDEEPVDEDVDPNEQRHMFFSAALTEMRGKEKQLATDPDCSVILERMSYSMDDTVRRVFFDSLTGSFKTLSMHRFASHVCQTFFAIARDTVSRETKGILPSVLTSDDQGELRTVTQLVLDACEELLPSLSTLIMDPFASHVIRSLLVLLCPNLSVAEDSTHSAMRSKKSATWKAKQGPMKSRNAYKSVPPEFSRMARRFVEALAEQLDDNEVRALAASRVASPSLQLILEVEADQNLSNEARSLMDRVMVGIIALCREDPDALPEESDYLGTLLRDTTSSHLLETIVLRCPEDAFKVLWAVYFKGKLSRLSIHPVANFVLAKALERISAEQLSEACTELDGSWGKIIKASRTGVIRAFIDRAATLQTLGDAIIEAVCSGFELTTQDDKLLLVPCVLSLLPIQEYKITKASAKSANKVEKSNGHRDRQPNTHDYIEPKVQGAVLLQSLLRLPDPHHLLIIESIKSLPMEERIKMAHNPSASRVYDVLLESPTVSSKNKRQFVMDFIDHYHELVDDRIGSRVGDRCWAFADTYLKEKIAGSLFAHELTLAGSFYGKYFARNLNMYLLKRKPDEWRSMQAERKNQSTMEPLSKAVKALSTEPTKSEAAPLPPMSESKKRKRKSHPEDEIDALFDSALGKRVKKAALGDHVDVPKPDAISKTKTEKDEKSKKKERRKDDDGLQDVLGAIRAAPKDDKSHKKKRKT
ncbi:armadillo-type protein [Cyathus striatus]|nr:armadillo-type protein [Cyathus striatus]